MKKVIKVNDIVLIIGLIFIVSFAIYFSNIQYQDTLIIKTIKNDISSLEVEIHKLDRRIAELDTPGNTSMTENYLDLKKELIENKTNLYDTIEKIDSEWKSLNIFRLSTYAYLVPLIMGIIVFFGIRYTVEQTAKRRLAEITDNKMETVERVFDSEVWSVDIRKKAKILAITYNEIDEGIQKFLDIKDNNGNPQFTWKKEVIKDLTLQKIQETIDGYDDYNCLFIENAKALKDKAENTWQNDSDFEKNLLEIGNNFCSEGKIVFYFSSGGPSSTRFPDLDNNNFLSSYANSESQIYPNLMNLFKIQYLLKKADVI